VSPVAQYLAVAAHASGDDGFAAYETYEGKACIQLWDMGDLTREYVQRCTLLGTGPFQKVSSFSIVAPYG
jgi:hypothetical protein